MTRLAHIYLDTTPCEEDCTDIGHPDYHDRALRESRAFISAIRKVCGEEPEHARLRVKREEHDMGMYLSVVCEFDPDDAAAAAYAAKVDEGAPTTWEAADMQAPVFAERSRGRV